MVFTQGWTCGHVRAGLAEFGPNSISLLEVNQVIGPELQHAKHGSWIGPWLLCFGLLPRA
jgi:hypothetical protein